MVTPVTNAPLPSLARQDPGGVVRGVVLLLHGGTEHSEEVVDGRSASWHRMAAIQRAVTPQAHRSGVATWLLRYRVRGWNDTGESPIQDARWALEQVARTYGDVPVVLLGHSMGARTALHVCDADPVRGVVGLAPWWPPETSVEPLRGRHLRAAHGAADKITSPRATRALVARAAGVAASTDFVDMGHVGHYMLRRVSAWNAVAREQSLAVLRD